jgi:transposase
MLDDAINSDAFLAHVEQFLAPTLAPSDIVVADNFASHKLAGVREAIEARDARLWFLPAYSNDLNPIEQGFAKKVRLRQGRSSQPRSIVAEHRLHRSGVHPSRTHKPSRKCRIRTVRLKTLEKRSSRFSFGAYGGR